VVTVTTEKIVDQFKPVGLWIRASQQSGMIEVGRNGEDLPFIYWTDPQPIPVKYYSFSAWGEVICKWMFKCKPDPTAVMARITDTTGYKKIHERVTGRVRPVNVETYNDD